MGVVQRERAVEDERVAADGRLLRWTAAALAASVLVSGLMGVAFLATGEANALRNFDLDAEHSYVSLWSALLLLAAGVTALLATRRGVGAGAVGVAVLLVAMAADEWFAIHEKLESTDSKDWQITYLPVFVVAGVLGLMALRRLRRYPVPFALFLGGGAAWFVAQVLEFVQWDGFTARPGYVFMMVPEELLEMSGTCLILLCFLRLVLHGPAAERRRAPVGGE